MGKVKTARKALKKKHANSGAKTHSGTKDRVKITGSGKLMIRGAGVGHLRNKKTSSNKRAQKHKSILTGKIAKSVKRLLKNTKKGA